MSKEAVAGKLGGLRTDFQTPKGAHVLECPPPLLLTSPATTNDDQGMDTDIGNGFYMTFSFESNKFPIGIGTVKTIGKLDMGVDLIIIL